MDAREAASLYVRFLIAGGEGELVYPGVPSAEHTAKSCALDLDGVSRGDSRYPELDPLLPHCAALIVRSDGLTCSVVMVTLAGHAPKPSRELLTSTGDSCRKYTGRVYKTTPPVGIYYLEFSDTPRTPTDEEALRELEVFTWWQPPVVVMPAHIAAPFTEGWSPGRFPLFFRSGLRRELRQSRELEEGAPHRAPVVAPDFDASPKVLTAIAMLLCAVFSVEIFVGGGGAVLSPTTAMLEMLGGLERNLVAGGDYYRIISGTFLHAGVVHLLCNLYALWRAGTLLERLIGPWWFAVIYGVSGVGGSVVSLCWNTPGTVSIGASGAVLGVIAALAVLAKRIPLHRGRGLVQADMIRWLLVSLLPAYGGGTIDISAHAGGALAGGVVAYVLLRWWRREEGASPGRSVAFGGALLYAGLIVTSLVTALWRAPAARLQLAHLAAAEDRQAGSDVSGALRELRAAAALGPLGLQERFEFAIVLSQNNLNGEAIALYEEIIRERDELAPAHFNLGLLLAREGRSDEAVRSLERARDLDTRDQPTRALLGEVLVQKHEWDAAQRELTAALALGPRKIEIVRLLAEAESELENWERAKALYREVVDRTEGQAELERYHAEAAEILAILEEP